MFQQSDLATLHRMQATAKRVSNMIHARACREYGLAFGRSDSTTLDMCVMHNSIVSRDDGKPWSEINYDHMRRAQWLCEQSSKPNQLVQAWYQRKCR